VASGSQGCRAPARGARPAPGGAGRRFSRPTWRGGVVTAVAARTLRCSCSVRAATGKEVVAACFTPSRRGWECLCRRHCGAIRKGWWRASCLAMPKGRSLGRQRRAPARFLESRRRHALPRRDQRAGSGPPGQVGGGAPGPHHYRPWASQDPASRHPVVAASNSDLQALVKQGKFRSDLFFRLNVVPITLPSLREARRGCAAPVSALPGIGQPARRRNVALSEAALAALQLYDWPAMCANWRTWWNAW